MRERRAARRRCRLGNRAMPKRCGAMASPRGAETTSGKPVRCRSNASEEPCAEQWRRRWETGDVEAKRREFRNVESSVAGKPAASDEAVRKSRAPKSERRRETGGAERTKRGTLARARPRRRRETGGEAESSGGFPMREVRYHRSRRLGDGARFVDSGDRSREDVDREGNFAVARSRTDRARVTGRRACARQTRRSGKPDAREGGHGKLIDRRKRVMRAQDDKRDVRATGRGERGRDGAVLWGTKGESSSRKQTHGVGNQAVRASRGKHFAWRNHARRAPWDEFRRSRNRVMRCVGTQSLRGQLRSESVVVDEFIVVNRHGEVRRRDACDRMGNHSVACSGNESRLAG